MYCKLSLAQTRVHGQQEVDDKQDFLHAFAMDREAMAFLERTLPLSGHFVEGRIQREDRLPVPADAMREVILNAVMHRDYANPGGDVSVAVFDDRIEIASYGSLPPGITPEMLSVVHPSVLRNPLIAQTFHRAGAVETWGRGTNRVIEECRGHGILPPTFEHRGNCLVVTFRAKIAITPQVRAVLETAMTPSSTAQLRNAAGLSDREHFRTAYLEPLLASGLLEMTIPDKPRSPKQQYRTTERGHQALNRMSKK